MKKSTIAIVRESLCQKFYKPPALNPEATDPQKSESQSLKWLSFACIRLELLSRRSGVQALLVLIALLYSITLDSQIKPYTIIGKVKDQSGNALSSVTIELEGTSLSTKSDAKGQFNLNSPQPKGSLQIRLLGYKTLIKEFDAGDSKELDIQLEETQHTLEEVNVISTGYQKLNKDKATGSFTTIDSSLINRTPTTNILDRLDGVTSGLLFNRSKTQGGKDDLLIRGRSTINGEDRPLIVLDNFPYEGDINNINPNDIKTITILKDAAAAAIWGTRAGNGVIVITTYKGNYGDKQIINFSSNITLTPKPALYNLPWFSSEKWIEIEKFLYDKGAYNSLINARYFPVSQAVEIFDGSKRGLISQADSMRMINSLKGNDLREDMSSYLYQPAYNQQYALNLRGGSAVNNYFLSAGLDRNTSNKVFESYLRINLTANNNFKAWKDRLEITTSLLFTSSTSQSGNDGFSPTSPYDELIDDNGQPLAVRNGLRLSYLDTAGKGRLLDWKYRPIDEARAGGKVALNSYIVNAGLNYKIMRGLKASLLYQYQLQTSNTLTVFDEDSYYTRNLINSLSTIDNSTGAVQRALPIGAIRINNDSRYSSNYGRFQMSYDNRIAKDQNLSAIAGIEVRDNQTNNLSQTLYGLNESTGVNANASLDFSKDYPLYYNPSASFRLDPNQRLGYLIDRFVSYYANASYSYKQKYIISLSARKDESNLFGVKPNEKGVPLWSAGFSWDLSKESFFHVDALPMLRLRGSFGYTGNVSKSISAYLTASTLGNNLYGAPFSTIINPPNPSLRWERIKIMNLGLDFAFKNQLSGSIEPFIKYGLDLFGTAPLPAQTGTISYQGNFANTITRGMDLTLRYQKRLGTVFWQSDLLLSLQNSKVTKYAALSSTNSAITAQSSSNPLTSNPYFAIYAYRWAGLDGKGDPQVYLNGKASKDYTAINNSLDRANIRLVGSSVPTVFGGFRNGFSYNGFELSWNITYRLGYYFRKTSLDNAALYGNNGFQINIDYENRWQKAGDEQFTNVSALLYPSNSQRNTVYRNSDILVLKADNIRLQDIRFGWNPSAAKKLLKIFSSLEIFTYLNNIGYIWLANKQGIDPDRQATSISNLPQPMSISFGLKATL